MPEAADILVQDRQTGLLADPSHADLLPNLFVIGASKAGSSALHAYLDYHPEIRMSDEKEPCFFVDMAELTAAWPSMARNPVSHDPKTYLDQFSGGEAATYRGESSVYYSQSPHRSGIPQRIAAISPDAKIIYLVRDPVIRTIGHYWQRAKEFQEPLPLEEAIEQNPLYRDTSDYALQLTAYRQHFPEGNIRVVIAEELRDDRRATMDGIVEWLGLPAHDFSVEDLKARHKSAPTSRKQRFGFVKTVRNSSAWATIRKFMPQSVVRSLRRSMTVDFDKGDVDDSAVKASLNAYFAPKIKELEQAIGREIPHWRPR